MLGGVELPDERGLAGHSDADVIAHAVADAILGACGMGDLGQHFPDTDPAWAGADSMGILSRVVTMAANERWHVVNVDCSVVLEAPRLAPYKADMARLLAAAASAGAGVNVKATRAEGLGALGRGEGVACWAVALVERP